MIAILMHRVAAALWLTLGWLSLSVLTLWTIGLGPHGFILFAFLPFWLGNLVALMVILVRYKKGT